jgi:hypothetical protein
MKNTSLEETGNVAAMDGWIPRSFQHGRLYILHECEVDDVDMSEPAKLT